MKNPCKGCTDRTITCHGVCRKYETWKKEHENEQEWLRKQKGPINEGAYKHMYERLNKIKKGHAKRRVKDYD